ncbi:MAG: Wzz/FepE/Etk N-terminal domain-containing protein [Patescibacteria group bacterium]|nr:Wzz/FepE/Etk N-terminal domain-containing protein [Patescibacteria group bacterium]
MELKEYLKIVKKHLILVIALILLIGGAAFLFSYFQPNTYEASVSFAVNRINTKETQDYQFDGYYAIQASDLVSQTVVSWFSTPSVVLEIYEKANISPQYNSLEEFATFFNTKKYSAQNINVKFKEKTQEKAENIAAATIEVINAKVKALNKSSDSDSLFEAQASSPVVVETTPNLWLNTIIGLVVGLILGLFLVYLVDYFKSEEKKEIY